MLEVTIDRPIYMLEVCKVSLCFYPVVDGQLLEDLVPFSPCLKSALISRLYFFSGWPGSLDYGDVS